MDQKKELIERLIKNSSITLDEALMLLDKLNEYPVIIDTQPIYPYQVYPPMPSYNPFFDKNVITCTC